MRAIIPYIIERHVDEASFLWERRRRACWSPLHDFRNLAELDERLEANLEGILLAGEFGMENALVALNTTNTAAELFVAAFVAAMRGDTMTFAILLAMAQKIKQGDDAIVSALEWLPTANARKMLVELIDVNSAPFLQSIGIRAYSARRDDPGQALVRLCTSSDAKVRQDAYRAVGELGRRDMLPLLRDGIREHDSASSSWAVWSAVLFGEINVVSSLWSVVEHSADSDQEAALAACDLAARHGAGRDVAERLEKLAENPVTRDAALVGAAARGDCIAIPWVFEMVEQSPGHAQRAGWVYASITGAALEAPLFNRLSVEDSSTDVLETKLMSPYEDLPIPDSVALRAHWRQVDLGFRAGERRLGGRIIESTWLEECLRNGKQPWRASASIEFVPRKRVLFPVAGLFRNQMARFLRWSSG